jgi:hypothetical protein
VMFPSAVTPKNKPLGYGSLFLRSSKLTIATKTTNITNETRDTESNLCFKTWIALYCFRAIYQTRIKN